MASNGGMDLRSNYLVLKPKEASFLDPFRLLFLSGDRLRDRKFIEWQWHEEKDAMRIRDLQHRWLIFVSLIGQMVLMLCEKPMAYVGSFLEFWLNLLSGNGGFRQLLLNILKGKVEIPDASSATFSSAIGNLDQRLDLDQNIKIEDRRKYEAALAMMAAKLSYENKPFIQKVVTDHWQMTFLDSYNFWNDYQGKSSTQAFIFRDKRADPELVVVAFRGTSPFNAADWRVDVDVSFHEIAGVGSVHRGFMNALGLRPSGCGGGWLKEVPSGSGSEAYAYYAIRQRLREILEETPAARVVVTGHSLGGALAILFAGALGMHGETEILRRLEGVYTFGQPRVGDARFAAHMEGTLRAHRVRYVRYVYCNDVVPRLPYDDGASLFKHFGTCLYFNSVYKAKVVKEEPNKNYFSVWWAIPKSINAVWELIRGLFLPYIAGPDYREGWMLRLYRVNGLVLPGLSAHCPQDYVNATRLGSLPPAML